ncbi:hypothetical protein [Streptosporangium sp. NPDC006007]|uniref:hypothetical protein n=1 Tax=Streptosporangium sp. NPDC006007 TaxID=3154575 RepID=UPI0033AC8C0D
MGTSAAAAPHTRCRQHAHREQRQARRRILLRGPLPGKGLVIDPLVRIAMPVNGLLCDSGAQIVDEADGLRVTVELYGLLVIDEEQQRAARPASAKELLGEPSLPPIIRTHRGYP